MKSPLSPNGNPFPPENVLGDPGRQPEIKSVSSTLNVGVADTALDFFSLGPIEVRGCSSRGWSHRYKGTPRQDDFSALVNDEVIVIAVADGVSEGDFSQVAAETAARSACKLVADQLAKHGQVDWVQVARRISMRIIEEAEYRKISQIDVVEPTLNERLTACLSKMSTTLIVAVMERAPRHDGFHAEIGVVAGDSGSYLLRCDADVLEPVGGGKEETDSITSTSVRPLPGKVRSSANRVVLQPGDALFVGSDGIGDPIGDGSGEVGQELARRWAGPPSIDRFLLDVNVYRRSFDDDRTAVGIWVRSNVELPVQVEDDLVETEVQPEIVTRSDASSGNSDAKMSEASTLAIQPEPIETQDASLEIQDAPIEVSPFVQSPDTESGRIDDAAAETVFAQGAMGLPDPQNEASGPLIGSPVDESQVEVYEVDTKRDGVQAVKILDALSPPGATSAASTSTQTDTGCAEELLSDDAREGRV